MYAYVLTATRFAMAGHMRLAQHRWPSWSSKNFAVFLSNNIQKSKIMIKPDLSLIYMQKPTRAGILEQPRSEEIIV